MKNQNLFKLAIKTSIALFSALLLVSCGQTDCEDGQTSAADAKTYQWKMVTSWPKNFPGLGVTPEKFATYVNQMSGGRLTVQVYGAGEIVPGLQVFDAVSQGTVQMGHSGAYYWKGKIPAAPIFSAIPFGMTSSEFNAWITYGGGQELWQELYKPFGIMPMLGGNSGAQFAGWFQKEINSIDDLQGLKMRLPGLGGEVLKRAGGVPVTITGGEIFSALQSGALDASEWVGPYNDLAFGFHQAAKYYYSTVWHEPGTALEFLVNEEAFNELPEDLQHIVKIAAKAANQSTLDEYNARNNNALKTLVNEHNVQLRTLPADVVAALKAISAEVITDQIAADAGFAKVWQSYSEFLSSMREYNNMTQLEYYLNRK
ncbi:MAG: TRAP transporter substrate-binding protein [Thalassotalea sp.]